MKPRDIKYKQQKKGIEWILKYFYERNVGDMFKNWKISYWVEYDKIKVSYIINNQETFITLPINTDIDTSPEDLKNILQDFMLMVYEKHERDWKTMRVIDIARLLWVHPNRLTNVLQKVFQETRYNHWHLLK